MKERIMKETRISNFSDSEGLGRASRADVEDGSDKVFVVIVVSKTRRILWMCVC